MVDALVGAGPAGVAARRALQDEQVLMVPAVLGAEVVSAVRALLRRGAISTGAANTALRAVSSLRTVSHPFEPFTTRVWELRENVTVYDAWYVALAEALGTELVTADRRLVSAAGPRCEVLDVGSFVGRRGGAG